MSRKKRDFKRPVTADPRFGDVVVGKAINVIMESGNKGVAERALYGALDHIALKTG
jgi:small subunit ribosomal protein S7